jgi:hypothetical protein
MGWVVNATPWLFYAQERDLVLLQEGGWPRANLDGCRKISLPLGFDSRLVQYVVSLCVKCPVLVCASFHTLFNLFFDDLIIVLFDAIQSELLTASVNEV